MTLVRALKGGIWDATQMAYQLDEDLLPDCPFRGVSSRYVWDSLRELQYAYQERHSGWREIPHEFQRLARALPTLVSLGAENAHTPPGYLTRPQQGCTVSLLTYPSGV